MPPKDKNWGKLSKKEVEKLSQELELEMKNKSETKQKVYNKLTNYYDFVQYCLLKLGAPIVNIELHDDQIRNVISDCLQLYSKNHFESLKEFYWIIKLSKEDVKRGYVQMPPDVLEIVDVKAPRDGLRASADLFDNIPFQIFASFSFSSYSSTASEAQDNLTMFGVSMMAIETMRSIFGNVVQYAFRQLEKKLFLYKQLKHNNVLLISGLKTVDPDDQDSDFIWDSSFLKKYAPARLGLQWAINLRKWKNVPASAGATVDADGLYEMYSALVEKLETEFRGSYTEPPRMFWG
jgi:hypothetical protein